jgi:signal transduction histidine kinase
MKPNLKILLIEDDDAFAYIIQRTVRKIGEEHSVRHVERISTALQELAADEFDVILTDLTLPDATKLEAIHSLQAFNRDLPVIVLTSMGSQRLSEKALQAGAQDYMVKDLVTPQLLERTMRHAIERQKVVVENTRLIAELETQQKQLNQKNERLQQLVETAHRFADNVSHEFRTPLTVIREYASLMRDEILGEINNEQAEFLEVIEYRVDDLNTMVDDMLDSSKLEAGIMGVHRVSTTPQEIVERPLTGLHLKAQVRGVELTYDADDSLPRVFCDPEKASRVVTNLVSNAIKFCDEEAGRVHVAAQHRPTTGDVEISVSDNGAGIDKEGLSQMFDRFRQLGTSTQSSTKGFGLGLNIVRELVDINYGTIDVESTLGEGTTIRFTIPVDDWPEIVRLSSARIAQNDPDASVVVVRIEADISQSETGFGKDLEAFWRFTERQNDLIRKTSESEWTMLFPANIDQAETVIE